MSAETHKMSVQAFGDVLIRSGDLDPAYIGLHGAALPRPQLGRWLLAYWCFYHVGAASYLSEWEGADYWAHMLCAAKNTVSPREFNLPSDRWPRAAERRHFRGEKCVDAVKWLQREFEKPENPVLHLTIHPGWDGEITEQKVMKYVMDWPMFGPWIAFKAADMLERVAGVPVQFDSNLGLMYSEPRAALDLLVATTRDGLTSDKNDQISSGITSSSWTAEDWYNNLSSYFRQHRAPPARDRPCGPQELETVLCKWKSYMGGHYHLGKDTAEHRAALLGWGQTAEKMLQYMPGEGKP